jgi:hypothetical protein
VQLGLESLPYLGGFRAICRRAGAIIRRPLPLGGGCGSKLDQLFHEGGVGRRNGTRQVGFERGASRSRLTSSR